MHFNCYPPIVHHHGYTVSRAGAQTFIGRYLAEARNNPTFRPDAELTQTGVSLRTHSADLGLGLKGLVDFEAGLRGERVYSADEVVVNCEGTATQQSSDPWRQNYDGARNDRGAPAPEDNSEEWIDKEQFERMQDEEIGGAEEGKEGVREVGNTPFRQVSVVDKSIEATAGNNKQQMDKEQRKALKKARRKEERKALARQAEQIVET